MAVVLKLIPRVKLSLSSAEARIKSSAGLSYSCQCSRTLEFCIRLGQEVVVSGQRRDIGTGRRSELVVIEKGSPLGVIRPAVRATLWDKLICGDSAYRLPTVFRPRIRELGLSFSRLGLLGLRSDVARVADSKDLTIALALMGYLYARSVFVE